MLFCFFAPGTEKGPYLSPYCPLFGSTFGYLLRSTFGPGPMVGPIFGAMLRPIFGTKFEPILGPWAHMWFYLGLCAILGPIFGHKYVGQPLGPIYGITPEI